MPGADGAPGAEPGADGALAELAGAYITRVTLPEGIKKIGNFAFYNATELAELELGSGIDTLGSDAFMNCRSLSRLLLHADPGQKTGLRLLLAQLSSDLEVALSGENGVWAKLLFPEYYESYDEIAPAHIFGRNIVGEGFRARQSFREDVLDFAQYDKIFPQACVDESEATLGRLALDRVRYAAELSEAPRGLYEEYLKAHSGYLIRRITDDRDLELAEDCCSRKFLTREDVAACAMRAGEADWAEGMPVCEEWQALAREFYTDSHKYWPKREDDAAKCAAAADNQKKWNQIARQTRMEQERRGEKPKDGEDLLAAQLAAGKSRRSYRDFLQKFAVLHE